MYISFILDYFVFCVRGETEENFKYFNETHSTFFYYARCVRCLKRQSARDICSYLCIISNLIKQKFIPKNESRVVTYIILLKIVSTALYIIIIINNVYGLSEYNTSLLFFFFSITSCFGRHILMITIILFHIIVVQCQAKSVELCYKIYLKCKNIQLNVIILIENAFLCE